MIFFKILYYHILCLIWPDNNISSSTHKDSHQLDASTDLNGIDTHLEEETNHTAPYSFEDIPVVVPDTSSVAVPIISPSTLCLESYPECIIHLLT